MADSKDYYLSIPCGTCGHAGSVHELNDLCYFVRKQDVVRRVLQQAGK